jgi:predicted RNase H-like HicB family nuclease
MRYAVVIRKTGEGYVVHVPDLPGCMASGPSPAEALREATLMIALHVEGLEGEGQPIPLPSSEAGYVEVFWELNRLGQPLPSVAPA